MKIFAIAALAVLLACQALAHSDSTMNEENELFDRCNSSAEAEVCVVKREHMVCEPAADYNSSWVEFVAAKGLPDPVNGGQAVDPKLGPIGYIAVRVSEHYGHTYIYIVLEDVVCLGAITHFLVGDAA